MPRGSNYQKPYPPEFRREAVELYRRWPLVAERDRGGLGVSTETLRMWVRRPTSTRGGGRVSSEERTELRELRRKVRRSSRSGRS